MELTQEQQELLNRENLNWIIDRIGAGEADATPALAIIFDKVMTDRDLRKHIETMRRAGIVIASSDKGYYFPADDVELRKYINKTSKAAKSLFKSLEAARKLLRAWEREGG